MISIKQLAIQDSSVIFEIDNVNKTIWDYDITKKIIDIKLNDINKVLNELLHLDDICIYIGEKRYVFRKSDYEYRLSESEIRRLKLEPFAHQIDAINFGLKKYRSKWLLLDSMG